MTAIKAIVFEFGDDIPSVTFFFYIVEKPSFGVAVTINGKILTTITNIIFYQWLYDFIVTNKNRIRNRIMKHYRKKNEGFPWASLYNVEYEIIEEIKKIIRKEVK